MRKIENDLLSRIHKQIQHAGFVHAEVLINALPGGGIFSQIFFENQFKDVETEIHAVGEGPVKVKGDKFVHNRSFVKGGLGGKFLQNASVCCTSGLKARRSS